MRRTLAFEWSVLMVAESLTIAVALRPLRGNPRRLRRITWAMGMGEASEAHINGSRKLSCVEPLTVRS